MPRTDPSTAPTDYPAWIVRHRGERPIRTEGETGTQRTALFIAYHYPPVRSTGTERTIRHVRHLPDFGYRARILTTSAFGCADREEDVVRAWEPLGSYRWLLNGAVRRGGSAAAARRTDPGPARGLVRLLRRWVLIPDGQITWLPAAAAAGLRHLRAAPADVIYSTYPPASAHLLGMLLKSLTGLPWVADFRDSWTGDPLDPALLEVPGRRRLERTMERAVMAGADAVVVATDISARLLREAHPDVVKRIRVITNGFDPDDDGGAKSLAGARADVAARAGGRAEEKPGPEQIGRLDIVHTGSFSLSHPDRSPQPLFSALASLVEEEASWARRIHLVLLGRLTPGEAAAAAGLVKAGVVEIRGEVDRAACLALQRRAGALLLLDHRRQGLSSNVPGKFYEYLAAGRPILALCGEGMVARMVDELKAGLRALPDEPAAIRRLLTDAYERFRTGTLTFRVPEERLRPFHRRELARQLAGCFDDVISSVADASATEQSHGG